MKYSVSIQFSPLHKWFALNWRFCHIPTHGIPNFSYSHWGEYKKIQPITLTSAGLYNWGQCSSQTRLRCIQFYHYAILSLVYIMLFVCKRLTKFKVPLSSRFTLKHQASVFSGDRHFPMSFQETEVMLVTRDNL